MSQSSEQHRILTEEKSQLTAELTALSNSMDKVCGSVVSVEFV